MAAKRYFLTEDEFQVIREHYDGSTVKIDKIMRILNASGPKYPRWYIRRIAAENGWARAKPANWNDSEVEWLHRNYPKKGFVPLQNGLKRINGGILRSRTAIVLKAKRERLNKHSGGFTMRMMEDLLGQDHYKIRKWVNLGLLSAKRKETDRVQAQGGDMWHFEARDVREFVINHPDEIDIRRVEAMNFIQLVAGLL